MHIESGSSDGDVVEHAGSGNCAQHLVNDVSEQIVRGEALPNYKPKADCRVQMTSRYVADGVGHGQHGESEGKSYSDEPDTYRGERSSDDGRTASSENETKCSKELRRQTLAHRHTNLRRDSVLD